MRGLLEKCPVVLASATPAIETRQQVEIGRYREIKLPSRYGGAELPEIEAIDLTRDPPERGRWIAPKLVGAMDEVLEKGEQALLFLNRRGYARSEEHTSELQSLMRISYAVFCLKKKQLRGDNNRHHITD